MTQKILVLDDEINVVSTLAMMLRNALKGFSTVTFTNPQDALENFSAHSKDFALIITDLCMPNMTGMDFCKKIRELSRDVPIVILTGYGEESSMEEAAKLNITDFIEKPIRLDSFIDVVKKAIENASGKKVAFEQATISRFKQQFLKQVELLLKGETPFGYTSTGFIINVFEQHGMDRTAVQSFKQAATLMSEETNYLEAKATVERLGRNRESRLQKLREWYEANKSF